VPLFRYLCTVPVYGSALTVNPYLRRRVRYLSTVEGYRGSYRIALTNHSPVYVSSLCNRYTVKLSLTLKKSVESEPDGNEFACCWNLYPKATTRFGLISIRTRVEISQGFVPLKGMGDLCPWSEKVREDDDGGSRHHSAYPLFQPWTSYWFNSLTDRFLQKVGTGMVLVIWLISTVSKVF
jgi:hypothetical protein